MKYIKMPKGVKKVINKLLKEKFDEEEAQKRWNKIEQLYDKFQEEQPDIGGTKNMLWEQMYASLAMFAYYEALDRKPTLEEMEYLSVESLIGNNRTFGKVIDFNWKWFQKIYGWAYIIVKKETDKHIADGSWNNTWKFELNPEGRSEGVNIRLIGCPVYDFAKAHGYENIMPALCKSDYKIFEPFHCKMIRRHTVANGDGYCEFWQVGDKSEAWNKVDKNTLI
ncbi:L-2-amino-thiazoline-4-carboxylic acid hydrolase [Clostridium sp. MSJ-8]|uniref:L-2-amino-thiazoline-4-carboxylic acid hydrolase n=1 Tax=Clostridium sp. MSJ-8 TaxID=2841510 RepID=UPI001C0F31DB|nr:L-2-amino-thiazoline-4-carboxylic acid hydrolase [Clostridium sp. MSJ-8]MBU5488287.1 L-2-amino-thiazoline-4-carboxylic acid hydrolase [Clostridium sp. MSJ-8]